MRRAGLMTTLSTYLSVTANIDRWRQITATSPDVQVDTRYFRDRFQKVASIEAFIKDRRLLAYALRAFGLGERIEATALVRRVLEQGVDRPDALARTLNDRRILDFARAFDFVGKGAGVLTKPENVNAIVDRYVDNALRESQGAPNAGVALALYFRDNAPKLTSIYGLLADKKLLEVVQTALDISPRMSSQQIDTQARLLKKKITIKDFSDPQKVERFLARFATMYDLKNARDFSPNVNASPLLFASAAQARGESPGVDFNLILRRQNIFRRQ